MRCKLLLMSVCVFLFCGCAVVELETKPTNAIELKGMIGDVSAVPYTGLSNAQSGAAYGVAGLSGVFFARALDSNTGNRGVSTVLVVISPQLSLILPLNKTFKMGDCVSLSIDPIYKELLERKDVPTMSLPVNAAFVQKVGC